MATMASDQGGPLRRAYYISRSTALQHDQIRISAVLPTASSCASLINQGKLITYSWLPLPPPLPWAAAPAPP